MGVRVGIEQLNDTRRIVDGDVLQNGYRLNVGIVLANSVGQVFWGRRISKPVFWQFPQGGMKPDETEEDAVFRELREEVGLDRENVAVRARTACWRKYKLRAELRRDRSYIGQLQRWFLLEMLSADSAVDLANASEPEFDDWQWVSYWYPLSQIVDFKEQVYRSTLLELAPYLPRGDSLDA